MNTKLIYLFFLITFVSCLREPSYKSVFFKNNSYSALNFATSYEFPDTSLSNLGYCCTGKLDPQKSCRSSLIDGWQNEFNRNPQKVLIVFVLDAYTVDSLSRNLENDYPVLKRYDLTLDKLEQLNWTITYP